jgi:hypothetical protein
MPATVWMLATAVTQATSNSKDDSNIMTAHNSKNPSNSRNESDNRTANTVWMPARAKMLLKSEMTAAEGGIASSWMTLSNSSRDNRNIADVNNRREISKIKDARNSRD